MAKNFLSRAKIVVGEKLGTTEKTELDKDYEELAEQVSTFKMNTESVISNVYACAVPDPSVRLEDKFDKVTGRTQKSSEMDCNPSVLGRNLASFGAQMGDRNRVGNILKKIGETELEMGSNERQYINRVKEQVLDPLKIFHDTELKDMMHKKEELNRERLDYAVILLKKKKVTNDYEIGKLDEELNMHREKFQAYHDLLSNKMHHFTTNPASVLLTSMQSLVSAQRNFHTAGARIMDNARTSLDHM